MGITFDDASPGQLRDLEENGTLRVDPTAADEGHAICNHTP